MQMTGRAEAGSSEGRRIWFRCGREWFSENVRFGLSTFRKVFGKCSASFGGYTAPLRRARRIAPSERASTSGQAYTSRRVYVSYTNVLSVTGSYTSAVTLRRGNEISSSRSRRMTSRQNSPPKYHRLHRRRRTQILPDD